MANTATRATLRTRAQRRADMENSQFLPDAEWDDLLDMGGAELHDIIVRTHEDYFSTTTSYPIVASQVQYTLPTDFLKLLQVDVIDATGYRSSVRRVMPHERNFYQKGAGNYGYRLFAGVLEMIPESPRGGGSIELRYVPQYMRFASDAATVNAMIPEGWEEYIALYAAIRALIKQRVDAGGLMTLLGDIRTRIETTAMERDANEPGRVVDIYNRFGDAGWDDY